jgi:hypothetical protein
VLLPASPVFDAFSQLLQTIWIGQVEGFAPLSSLNDVGHFARVRMEFLKRLCTARYGIGEGIPTPVGGDVHVWGSWSGWADLQVREAPNSNRNVPAGTAIAGRLA